MRYFLLFFIVAGLFSGCGKSPEASAEKEPVEYELPDIQKSGTLRAITVYSATSYFIYKGEPMGYEYELLNLLADHLGLNLDIIIARDVDEIFNMLNNGEGDVIAAGLTITKERARKVSFTDYYTITRQVLVQRKPPNWRKMKLHQIEKKLIRNPIDLIAKDVYVRKGSSYFTRLQNLSEEIGGDINIIEVPGDITTEKLIKKVADGEIDYTVADENIALVNQAYYPNLDVATAVSFPQRTAWAVRKNSPLLLQAINDWIDGFKQKVDYYVIYNKYFKNRRAFRERLKSEYFSISGGKISEYDDIIKAFADSLDWDWRLLASQIYQESRFDPAVKSWAGAIGLMQLLPRTARKYGAVNILEPYDNILAGTNYLHWLENYWAKIKDEQERIKFVLASYNTGFGHVEDARNLAKKYGKNPDKWEGNVGEYILKLSAKEFYNDEVVKHGYCRGEEPVRYVDEVLKRYEDYKRLIEE